MEDAANESRFSYVRKWCHMARIWHSKPLGYKRLRPEFAVTHPRHFRRAFVEVMTRPFITCQPSAAGGATLEVMGKGVATITPEGGYRSDATDRAYVLCAPRIIRDVAADIYLKRVSLVGDRYKALAPYGALYATDNGAMYRELMLRTLRPIIMSCIKQFSAYLHPDLKRLAHRHSITSAGQLAMLSPDDPVQGCWIREAYDSYPVLFLDMGPALHEAVCRGESVLDALAEAKQCRVSTIRKLRGFTYQRVIKTKRQSMDMLYLIPMLDHYPDHLWPRSRKDFEVAREIATRVPWAVGPNGVAALFNGCKQALSKDKRLVNIGLVDELSNSLRSVMRTEPTAVLAGMSLGRLLKLTHQLHVHIAKTTQELAKSFDADVDAGTWLGVLPEKELVVGDRTVVELTTPYELVMEGARQRHCVASYAVQCFSGRSRILSFRDKDGTVLSTAELALRAGAGKAYVVQHHSSNNHKPAKACVTALRQVMRIINHKNSGARLVWPEVEGARDMQHQQRWDMDVAVRSFWINALPAHSGTFNEATYMDPRLDFGRPHPPVLAELLARVEECEIAF